MNRISKLASGLAVLALSACAGGQPVARSTGAAPLGYAAITDTVPGQAVLVPRYNVQGVRVEVPDELVVSEANLFYPIADIVWRGEPRGDRKAQIHTIFLEAFGFGTTGMRSGPAVIVEARVARFHALTEKTRYTFGGVHSIRFDLTVRDAATGAVIEGPRRVVADIRASGGARAVAEEQAGRTQRVVIVEALSQTIRRELSSIAGAPDAAAASPGPVAATAPVPGSAASQDVVVSQGTAQQIALPPIPAPSAAPTRTQLAQEPPRTRSLKATERALMWSVQSSL